MAAPLRCTREREGRLVRLLLDRPKGNVLDMEMIQAIRAELARVPGGPSVPKLLVFEGAGPNFSFGASVAEHLPDKVGTMLPAFHQLFRDLESLGVPTAAVVRGHCLGGAFELAIWCGMVFCAPGSKFAVPETGLAVFPPVAALALPWRVSGARATRLILTGETLDGASALREGIADECSEDPEAALQEWFSSRLEPKSSVALRAAWKASRLPLARALERDLPALEDLYLRDLMSRRDPAEGLAAFLERRNPVWSDA
jgi:cyclohexa-1,5-dienecarbonyl-CoA hydratase